MKVLFTLLCSMLMLTLSCTSSECKEICVSIYEEGITKIHHATTQQEISDISYDVAKKIVDVSQGPDGDVKLSSNDQMELFNAQQRFYQAIESRARQLVPSQDINNNEPIIRTSVK